MSVMQPFLILNKHQMSKGKTIQVWASIQKPRLESQNITFVYKGWVGVVFSIK